MQRLGNLPCRRPYHRISAQIEVIGSKISIVRSEAIRLGHTLSELSTQPTGDSANQPSAADCPRSSGNQRCPTALPVAGGDDEDVRCSTILALVKRVNGFHAQHNSRVAQEHKSSGGRGLQATALSSTGLRLWPEAPFQGLRQGL